jgi:hypothetical protein
LGYWKKIKRDFPDVFKRRCEQSRKYGCKLLYVTMQDGTRQHLFLDELTDEMKGIEPKGFDCGIFCAAEYTEQKEKK